MTIDPIQLLHNVPNRLENKKGEDNNALSFNDILKQALNSVQDLQKANANNNYLLATGEIENLHKIMIDAEKADIALQFSIQVRNKVLEAYQEIMRMQI
ncbi:MAG: flagellar hook-basal body complex protein FliE [Clostridiales bacterium]|nr:flagellar hook-basal body complex protein FliE [Clostridiales bacterium]